MLRAGRFAAAGGACALALLPLVAVPARAQDRPAGTTVARPAGTVITLPEALDLARTRNVALLRARTAEAQQRLAVDGLLAARQPTLSIGGNAGRGFGRTLVENRIASGTSDQAGLNLSSNILVYDGGATRLQAEQARVGIGALEAQRARAEQTVAYNVVRGYINLAAQRENVRRLEEQVTLAQQQLDRINAFIAERVRAEADRFAQEAEVAAARVEVAQAERAVALAEATLVGLLGLDPVQPYTFVAPPLAALDSVAARQTIEAYENLSARAFARRPDLAALEAQRRAAEVGVRAARAGSRPQIGAGFSYGTNWSGEYRRAAFDPVSGQPVYTDVSLFDQLDERRGGSFGVNLSLPLLDQNRTALAVQRARVQLDDAGLAFEEQRQRIQSELAEALAELRALPAQIAAAEAQVRAARRALEAAEDRYRYASGTVYDVAQARAALVRAEGNLLQARTTLAAQRAALDYTLGTLDPEALLGR